jgi:serine/threonine protein phosphatase PrpC
MTNPALPIAHAYARPYLTYSSPSNTTITARDLDELSYIDQKTQICFVKYHDDDHRGFLLDINHKELVLTTVSKNFSLWENVWVPEPTRWFFPIPLTSSITESNPEMTTPPFNLKKSKEHIIRTYETNIALGSTLCFYYIPFSGLISIQDSARISMKIFINCFSDNRGIMIDQKYQDQILPHLPYILSDTVINGLLSTHGKTKPFLMKSTPIKNHLHSMYKNSQKAHTEHLDVLKKRIACNQDCIDILNAIGVDLFKQPLETFKGPFTLPRAHQNSKYPRALIEYLYHRIYTSKHHHQSLNTLILKLQQEIDNLNTPIYISKEELPSIEAISRQTLKTTIISQSFTYSICSEQGTRKSMEDAHFFQDFNEGIIMGVFDGHGGSDVARYASQEFVRRFQDSFLENKDPFYSFTTLVEEINDEIFTHDEWSHQGSTALISFIDKTTSLIYTATIGDSEANIYRKTVDGLYRSIPLSCLRDWSHSKEAIRASKYYQEPHISVTWPKEPQPKKLRLNKLNISRSLGDRSSALSPANQPGIIPKPKITIQTIMRGDILILACDGLKDYVPEKDIVQILNDYDHDSTIELASLLTSQALDTFNSKDNVTVIALKCLYSSVA